MSPGATALGSFGRSRPGPIYSHHLYKQGRLQLPLLVGTPLPARAIKCSVQVSEESALAQSFESAFLQAQEQQQQSDQRSRTPGRQTELPPEDERERVFLVGAAIKGEQRRHTYDVHESVDELGRLAETAGLRVMGSTYQLLDAPNMSTYIGSGKVAEVGRAVAALGVETVIFDDELSPGQLRNLERQLGTAAGGGEGSVRVCDRTALILDIFSQRAQTREGQLQVELAQTEYQLPRLTRMWTHLDRVGGGGQVKGAGEKQIEVDKRLLRDRAAALRRELEAVRTHRRQYRDKRSATPIPVVGICGYTNAGKSTLLNTLTNAGVLAEDQLFATLDPTTRRLRLKGNKEILMSDTVGFIQKLPTELVAAFRATLEEIRDASIILHVVDISHPNAAAQNAAVMQVLEELGIGGGDMPPMVTAWNKVDATSNPEEIRRVAAKRSRTVCISGRTGEGLDELLELLGQVLEESMEEVRALLPYSAGDLLNELHTGGRVKCVEYTPGGVAVVAAAPAALVGRLRHAGVLLESEVKAGCAGGEEDGGEDGDELVLL
ncbi:hypothetical protein VOLCADRAFT_108445 [Volvox carteri f. nagariensis]|uniref:Hflx-type G domain-containing protein n=1 Tax=Volvox carteri f. nagariensis TaxID=3068 RepID=D8UK55_VOLCA|nr:uncharacterized protein VOLCADRAFT_108445 [Volvox carteri f. nagariensis]EFJ39892.1 hypothetical protein VOLCADRAFT_108445 [Volvox carteri f. nagariensis]|eukprot:XP_002959031.1 hypothetical protein VOLCADRAFT_108445 [Volvox carteri f. nagariensis]